MPNKAVSRIEAVSQEGVGRCEGAGMDRISASVLLTGGAPLVRPHFACPLTSLGPL